MPRRAVLLALLLLAAPAARAEEPPAPAADAAPQNAPDAAARVAIERWRRDATDPQPKVRIAAMQNLTKVLHPTVADELLSVAFDAKAETRYRTMAFKGLATQTTSAKTVPSKVSKFLADAAEENRKRKARGDYGVLIDPKTNKTDTESPEGKEALRLKRERGDMLAAAVGVIDAFSHRDRDSVEVLTEFLSDGNDDLVALVIGLFAKWKEWSVLPDLCELFEMYPEEKKVNVGSTSVDTGSSGSGDAQAAKRQWMAKYGDPDRRRARPAVFRAFKKAMKDITGEDFATPPDLREYLRRPEVKRKVRAK